MSHSPAFLTIVNSAKENTHEITIDEVLRKREQGDDFVFIDVREDSEWALGRATGAVHIGKGVIERDIEAQVPMKSQQLVLYCGGGFRSALAAEALQKMGYTNVLSMAGGIRSWRERNLPEER